MKRTPALECSSFDMYFWQQWADREWVYETFDNTRLESWQRLNHFRNGRELCRKDLMHKNLKRKKVVTHLFK